jgi:hypothetical protein
LLSLKVEDAKATQKRKNEKGGGKKATQEDAVSLLFVVIFLV